MSLTAIHLSTAAAKKLKGEEETPLYPRIYMPGGHAILLTERGSSLKSEFIKHRGIYMPPAAAEADLEMEAVDLEMQSSIFNMPSTSLAIGKIWQKAFYEGTKKPDSPPLEEQMESAPMLAMTTCGYYLGHIDEATEERLDALEL